MEKGSDLLGTFTISVNNDEKDVCLWAEEKKRIAKCETQTQKRDRQEAKKGNATNHPLSSSIFPPGTSSRPGPRRKSGRGEERNRKESVSKKKRMIGKEQGG